jgi:hypothetical protein
MTRDGGLHGYFPLIFERLLGYVLLLMSRRVIW